LFIFGGFRLPGKVANVLIPIWVSATYEADGLGLSQHAEQVLPAPHDDGQVVDPRLMMRAEA
jgi:hypothetical protein